MREADSATGRAQLLGKVSTTVRVSSGSRGYAGETGAFSRNEGTVRWLGVSTQEKEITGLQPGDALESATLATLAAGNYTAIMQGVGGGTGIGLVEAYPLD